MSIQNSEITDHLAALLRLNEASAQVFPELPNLMERVVLLAALALADADGRLEVETWAQHTGISVTVLQRFAKAFAQLGYISLDEFADGKVRLCPPSVEGPQRRRRSGGQQ